MVDHLFRVYREIRGFLMKHTTNIDMKNAHLKILLYLCKKYEFITSKLKYYCDNREEILSKHDDREKGKALYLKALNKSNLTKEIPKSSRDMIEIQRLFETVNEFQGISSSTTIEGKKYNKGGSFINHYKYIYENKLLQCAVEFIESLRLVIRCLTFDGIIIDGNYYHDDNK
jgi:hypothetical protein